MCTASCCQSQVTSPNDASLVLGAVLEYVHEELLPADGTRSDDVRIFVIQRETATDEQDLREWGETCEYLRSHGLDGLQGDTCDAFLDANARYVRLDQFDAGLPIELVRKGSFEESLREGPLDKVWRDFYVRHPGAQGFLRLSSPGVSEDGHQALVFLHNSRGSLEGWAGYCLLEREGETWRVTHWVMTQMS